jgi:hypothetical protein
MSLASMWSNSSDATSSPNSFASRMGAKMLYEFLSERFGSDESRSVRTTESVPFPLARPSQHTLRPADLMPQWRGAGS